jgi:hypothetical protein
VTIEKNIGRCLELKDQPGMNSVIRKIVDVAMNKILVWSIDMKFFEKLKSTNQKRKMKAAIPCLTVVDFRQPYWQLGRKHPMIGLTAVTGPWPNNQSHAGFHGC